MFFSSSAIACLEHLIQGPAHESVDPESELHSDIFFTTHKVWFYLSDVRLESGPLGLREAISLVNATVPLLHLQRKRY